MLMYFCQAGRTRSEQTTQFYSLFCFRYQHFAKLSAVGFDSVFLLSSVKSSDCMMAFPSSLCHAMRGFVLMIGLSFLWLLPQCRGSVIITASALFSLSSLSLNWYSRQRKTTITHPTRSSKRNSCVYILVCSC
jgi:hypothetical protein